MTPWRQSFQATKKGSMIHSLPGHHTPCSRFLPPVDDFYVQGCAAFLRGFYFPFSQTRYGTSVCFFFSCDIFATCATT